MNSIPSRRFSILSFLATLVALLLAAGQNVRASAGDHVDDGLTVSKSWVAQIDAGRYDDSYTSGSEEMRNKIGQNNWDAVLKAIRGSWGNVVDRHQISHVYKPDGFEGTEGEFLVITYETSFQKLPDALELVVLRWEDGQWRGAGYNAGAKPSNTDTTADQPPNSTTEVQTEEHMKPLPQ